MVGAAEKGAAGQTVWPLSWRDALAGVLWYAMVSVVVGGVAGLAMGIILRAVQPGLNPDQIGQVISGSFYFVVTITTVINLVVLLALRGRAKRHLPRPIAMFFPKTSVSSLFWAAVIAAVIVAAASGLEWGLQNQYGIDFKLSSAEAAMMPETPVELAVAIVAFVLFVPFCEEYLFRGFILGGLRRHMPGWLAIVLSAAVFAAAHGLFILREDVSGWISTGQLFVVGTFMAWLTVRTGSLRPSWVLHIVNNGLAFGLGYLAAS